MNENMVTTFPFFIVDLLTLLEQKGETIWQTYERKREMNARRKMITQKKVWFKQKFMWFLFEVYSQSPIVSPKSFS